MVKKYLGKSRPTWAKLTQVILLTLGAVAESGVIDIWQPIHLILIQNGIDIDKRIVVTMSIISIIVLQFTKKKEPKISEDVNDDKNRDLDNSY